jgi:trehalose utilization protein
LRVTVWNEFIHERRDREVQAVYPEGIHTVLGGFLKEEGFSVRFALLQQPEHGLTDEVLDQTDVLIWWGHAAHDAVEDEVVERVTTRILSGMGFIALHASQKAKVFRRLMGTSCGLKWREAGEKERLWVVEPGHPICRGLPEYFELEQEEMYGEPFDIPQPESVVFLSWFQGGEVFRSGCTFTRGAGKIFYFQPGHETYPTYYNPVVQKVICNAVRWAAPSNGPVPTYGNHKPLEEITGKEG